MKVIHIVPHVGNEASGPTYSAVRLSQSIAARNNEVLLFTVKGGEVSAAESFQHRVFPKAGFPSMLWRSPELYQALLSESQSAGILHSHSLWIMPNVYPGWAAQKTSTPLMLSPRGTLTKWALSNSAVRKKIFWAMFQKSVVKSAACLHVTSEDEYLDIRRVGMKQPVCIIPNGIDIPDVKPKDYLSFSSESRLKTLLYLGRLHAIKGIDILIQAWSEIATSRPDWQLRIVGPGGERYTNELKSLVSKLKVPRVEFVGPVFGTEKQMEYQRADLFVLSTHSENFGMTVAEALANGTPVITTKNAPWEGLVRNDCGWWIDLTLEELGSTLAQATLMDSQALSKMGKRGRHWVSNEYDWMTIATQMSSVYEWLISGGTPPDCVVLD